MQIDSSHEAFDRVRAALIEAARDRRLLTYPDVAAIMGLTYGGSAMGTKVGAMGDAINRFEHDAGRPMLSALIVKTQSRVPGEGFYRSALALGRTTAFGDAMSDREFWESERDAVYNEWAR
jgi:hypothetical protein